MGNIRIVPKFWEYSDRKNERYMLESWLIQVCQDVNGMLCTYAKVSITKLTTVLSRKNGSHTVRNDFCASCWAACRASSPAGERRKRLMVVLLAASIPWMLHRGSGLGKIAANVILV